MSKPHTIFALLILASLFLTACAPQPGQTLPSPTMPSPTTVPTLAETSTNTQLPSPTPEPLLTGPFIDSDRDFVFAPNDDNAWESVFIFPAGALSFEGQHYMYYTGIGRSWPQDVAVGVATSSDGQNWQRSSENPLLTVAGVPFAAQTILGSSAIVLDDGTWALYFYTIGTSDNAAQGASWIGRATADNPLGPFTADPIPVLMPGPEGSWDSFTVKNPDVILVDDTYWMYYDGSDVNPELTGFESIGLAFSDDGINWIKHNDPETSNPPFTDSDPIFLASAEESAWDGERVLEPNVIQTQDGWLMLYVSDNTGVSGQKSFGIGYALSQDGITWQRPSAEDPLVWTRDKLWHWIYTLSLLEIDGNIHALYSARPSRSPATTNVYTLIQFDDLFQE